MQSAEVRLVATSNAFERFVVPAGRHLDTQFSAALIVSGVLTLIGCIKGMYQGDGKLNIEIA